MCIRDRSRRAWPAAPPRPAARAERHAGACAGPRGASERVKFHARALPFVGTCVSALQAYKVKYKGVSRLAQVALLLLSPQNKAVAPVVPPCRTGAQPSPETLPFPCAALPWLCSFRPIPAFDPFLRLANLLRAHHPLGGLLSPRLISGRTLVLFRSDRRSLDEGGLSDVVRDV